MKRLRHDNAGFLLNIGPLMIIGFILMAVVSWSTIAHNADFAQDTFLGTLYQWSWLLVMVVAGLFMARFLQDPRAVFVISLMAGALWYFVVIN
jgi:hypothetical protein